MTDRTREEIARISAMADEIGPARTAATLGMKPKAVESIRRRHRRYLAKHGHVPQGKRVEPVEWDDEAPTDPRMAAVPEKEPVDLFEAYKSRVATSKERETIANLLEQLSAAKERQAFIDHARSAAHMPVIVPREHKSGIRELTAVVLASDWHVEEKVEAESVAYRNEYNLEIAAKRVERFFDGIIWHVQHQRASGKLLIRDLVLWLGGDLITGYIHEELVESNELSPTEAVLWLIPRLRGGIKRVLEALKLESITVPCSFGNHGRNTEKRRVSTGYANSYEWLMYNLLAEMMNDDPRIQFEITASAHQYVQVYDRVIHFHHGDDVRYLGGVGGLTIPLMKRIPNWDLVKKSDVAVIGHYHQLLDLGRAVCNGSLIGYNAFAQSIGAPYEEPQQALFYIDSKRGKCMSSAIWVTDGKEHEVE